MKKTVFLATTAVTAVMVTGRKQLKVNGEKVKYLSPVTEPGTFEPQVIEKRQTRTDDMEARVLAMYQKGMSVRDIEDHIRDIYGVDASASLISRITDKIMPELIEWQQRPLSEIYPVVFFDGIYYKVRKDSKE